MWYEWQNSNLGKGWTNFVTHFIAQISPQCYGQNLLIFGFDYNINSISIKNKFYIHSSKISKKTNILSNPNQLPFRNNSIDCIICIHYLDMLDKAQIKPYLDEVHRVLVPYGKFITINFNPYGIWYLYHKFFKNFLPLDKKHTGISYIDLQNYLEHGFSLKQANFALYQLAFQDKKYSKFYDKLNKMGNRWWPNLSNVYAMMFSKEVIGMHAITIEQEKADNNYIIDILPATNKNIKKNNIN